MSTLTQDQKIRLASSIGEYILDMGHELGAHAGDTLYAAHSAIAWLMFDVLREAPAGDRRRAFEHAATFYRGLADCGEDLDLDKLARQ